MFCPPFRSKAKSGSGGAAVVLICAPTFVRKDAGRACQQKIDQIPALIGIELVGEARHNPIVTPMAHPPENFSDLVREQVRLGQISRTNRKFAGKWAVAATVRSVAHGAILGVKRCAMRYGWCCVRPCRGIKARRVCANNTGLERNPTNTTEEYDASDGSGHLAVPSFFGGERRCGETKDERDSGDDEHRLFARCNLTEIQPEREWPAWFSVQPRRQHTDDADDGENEDTEARLNGRVAAELPNCTQSGGGVTRDVRKLRYEAALVDTRDSDHRCEQRHFHEQKLTVRRASSAGTLPDKNHVFTRPVASNVPTLNMPRLEKRDVVTRATVTASGLPSPRA